MIGTGIVVLSLLLPPYLQASDLAALARKERERRAKIAKPAPVMTEGDAREAAAAGKGSVIAVEGVEPPAQELAPTSIAAREADWRRRAELARSAVTAAERRLVQMEAELVAFSSDLAPLSAAEALDPLRLQTRGARIAEMRKNVEAQKAVVETARNSLVALQERARQEGVPPGWLR